MKYTVAAIAALSLVSFTCVQNAEAGPGGRSVRIDQGNNAGCMSSYTTAATATGAAADSSPDGAFTPGGTFANSTTCTTPAGSSESVLFPQDGPNAAAYYGGGNALTSPYVATSGTMYQFFVGALSTGGFANSPDAQVGVWGLATGPFGTSETEIELNGWCAGGSGASFKFDGNTFAGGCSTSSSNDLIFSKTGQVVGYANYASATGVTVSALSGTLQGWTENGKAITGGGGTISAPEIDPSSAAAALALLLGGLAVLRGSRKAPVRIAR